MFGTTLAHYKVTATRGRGGMGAVYRANDTKLDRKVAIKVLPTNIYRIGRILKLRPAAHLLWSADLRSGVSAANVQLRPGRRPALRGHCQAALRSLGQRALRLIQP